MFQKIKRVHEFDISFISYNSRFQKEFPELNKVSNEKIAERWRKLGVDFYTMESVKTRTWIRFTLPFALILFLMMYIFIPVYFIINGRWAYNLKNNSTIINWFRELKIL
jgi:hypothetical protein